MRQYVQVKGRFHRSVHIRRDWEDPGSLRDYIVTPTGRDLALRIVSSLRQEHAPRAWSITGPYGSGKSAFALFLADVLVSRPCVHPEAEAIRIAASLPKAPMLLVAVVGHRSSLLPALLSSLADAIREIDPRFSEHARGRSSQTGGQDISSLFSEAVTLARAAGYGGLLVMVDEMGKFLEHASVHPETDDLFVLQHLAETAARNPGGLVLVTVLHSAIADYLRHGNNAQLAEWQKIQGRFTDVAFHLPMDQFLRLVGDALEPRWPVALDRAYRDLIKSMFHSNVLLQASRRAPVQSVLHACLPLHPMTALLLGPLFRSKMAQNERSLFAFLTSAEAFGFQEFLDTEVWDNAWVPMYRVDALYDYVISAIGTAALLGDRARRWAEIQDGLDRLPVEAPPLAPSLIKTIGLLGIYGSPAGLKADAESLTVALGDPRGVEEALAFLRQGSFVIYRRHLEAYSLWAGSDVDIDACLEEAHRYTQEGSLAERMKQVVSLRPWVARAHYITTGTLRYFRVDVIDGTREYMRAAVGRATEDETGDGNIIFVLAREAGEREALLAEGEILTRQAESRERLCLLAFPKPLVGLEETVRELGAWLWVQQNVTALAGDSVASEEVRGRVVHARDRVSSSVGPLLGISGFTRDAASSEWVYAGVRQPVRNARQFSQWLSQLCDHMYRDTPVFPNELLNRDHLSSAAAAARRNLLEAMLVARDKPRLGIEGWPPEATMYETLLRMGGFHRVRDGTWCFGPPSEQWTPVWRALQAFLLACTDSPRPVEELFASLRRPPFGLRDGPMPVLLLALLLSMPDEVALYDEGVYVPEVRIEVMERLVRKPGDYLLRYIALNEPVRQILRSLSRSFTDGKLDAGHENNGELLSIARGLVLLVAALPPYSRHTRRFDDPTFVRVREELVRARDPYALVFEDLPRIFGLSAATGDDAERLASRLREAVLALQQAYPALLDEIAYSIRAAFGLGERGADAVGELRRRSTSLLSYATDKRLAAFIKEAAREMHRDWRESLARVIVDGSPPSSWRDPDVVMFQARLRLLASDFVRLEELVSEHERAGGVAVVRVGLLDGTLQEASALLTVPPEEEEEVRQLTEKLVTVLSGTPAEYNTNNLRLAALARALARQLEPE